MEPSKSQALQTPQSTFDESNQPGSSSSTASTPTTTSTIITAAPRNGSLSPLTKLPTIDSRSGSSTTGDDFAEDARDLRCCCRHIHVRTGTVVIALLEILLLFHSLIFLVVNLAVGDRRYAEYIPDFAEVIRYEYFIPMIVLQSLWILGDIVAVFAVKLINPSLMFVHFALRIPPLLAHVILATMFIANAAQIDWARYESINIALVLTLSIFVSATITALYFTYVTYLCLKYLRHFTKIIASQRFCYETGAIIGTIDERIMNENHQQPPIDPFQIHPYQGDFAAQILGIENRVYESTEVQKLDNPRLENF